MLIELLNSGAFLLQKSVVVTVVAYKTHLGHDCALSIGVLHLGQATSSPKDPGACSICVSTGRVGGASLIT